MATVTTTTGAFSGIDTAGIIDKLMSIEQRPLDKLNQRKEDYQKEISSYGEISSVISTLRTAVKGLKSSNISSFTATSSDETILKASAGAGAGAGNYSIEVTQLAQDQKISSQTYSSDKVVFTSGTLTVVGGKSSAVININYKNNTLTGIKDAINSAGVGASATVIKDNSGYRLVVSSKDGGASGGVSIFANDTGSAGQTLGDLAFDSEFPSGASMTITQKGQDAIVKIDGQSITSGSNTLTGVMSGLTIDLKKAAVGTNVKLSVEQGSIADSTNLKTFVDSYNAAMTKLKDLSAKGETLSGDRTVKTIISQLQKVTTTSYGGSMLAQFGISHDKSGVMILESSKLDSSAADRQTEFNAMMDSLSLGFDATLRDIVRDMIPSRTNTISIQKSRIDNDVARLTSSLEKTRESYQKRFAAMEATIGNLQSQSTSMANMLPSNDK
ncbi:flagellar hook-associated 2 domain-containing protein [Candidatus Magnetobacterium bavaricum]|uniref:Flagellar hook-associated protein 2 n=1 Tax=Candidatus Magnetobacterium bavaricum TaxID=29290 RepID=A0A0F3GJU3_9BACT|nr:flagellar hook-associated 2 domain-containing protein [Candidatus Magnetobacterium bavaricum]